MRKIYTEPELIALIDQYKSRKSYALQCANDPAYVAHNVAEIDRQIETLTKRRKTITDAVEKTDEIVKLCDDKMRSLRKQLEFCRKHGGVGKLLALKEKAAALERELNKAR